MIALPAVVDVEFYRGDGGAPNAEFGVRAKEAEIARAQSARQTAINEHDNTIRGLTAELAALNAQANLNL
jgi:hypothetical protein